jgi:hypothetical protein
MGKNEVNHNIKYLLFLNTKLKATLNCSVAQKRHFTFILSIVAKYSLKQFPQR